MRAARRLAFVWVPAFAVAGCVIDIPDVVTSGDAQPDGPVDGGADTQGDAPACTGACGVPAGFSPVLFDPTGANTCPKGTSTVDVIGSLGTVPASACSCTCSVTSPPSCLPASVGYRYEQNSPCDQTSNIVLTGGCDPASGGAANAASMSIDSFAAVDPGACATAQTSDSSVIPTTPARMCVDPKCAATCAPSNSFKACASAPGNLTCPAGFTAYHVGTAVSLQCSPCGACTMASSPCQGTVELFSDNGCFAQTAFFTVNGQCANVNVLRMSLKYVPTITPGCAVGPSDGGTATLTSPTTVCCPP